MEKGRTVFETWEVGCALDVEHHDPFYVILG
jgi:hypothetical protein